MERSTRYNDMIMYYQINNKTWNSLMPSQKYVLCQIYKRDNKEIKSDYEINFSIEMQLNNNKPNRNSIISNSTYSKRLRKLFNI